MTAVAWLSFWLGCHSDPDQKPSVAGGSAAGSGGREPDGRAGGDVRDDDDAGPGDAASRSDAGAAPRFSGGAGGKAGISPAGAGGGLSEAGAGGKAPIPIGELRQAAIDAERFVGAAVSVTALQDDARYRDVLASQFSAVTPENALKWGALEPTRGSWTFADADRIVEAARAAGQLIKGHAFVWHKQLPEWATSLSASELENALHEHITETARHFKGQLYSWDVVNEAIDDETLQLRSGVHATLGVAGLARAYQWVKAADPDVLLFYNDYSIEEPNAKTDAVYRLIQELREQGAVIDGVGLQAHLDMINYPSERGLRANLRRFAGLDLKVSYSELDVRTKNADPNGDRARRIAAQRFPYQLIGGVCASEPACSGITLWGFSDKYTWIEDDDPLIFDAAYEKKPSYTGLLRGLAGELPSAGENLVSNGDFETGKPSGWIASGGGDSTLSVQSTVARSGFAGMSSNRSEPYQGPGHVLSAGLRSGDPVCIVAQLRVSAASAQVNATLRLTIDDLATYVGVGVTTARDDGWAEISGCRAVYFAGTPSEAALYFERPPAGVVIYIDDVSAWALSD